MKGEISMDGFKDYEKNNTEGNNYWRGYYNGQYKAQDPYYSYYSAQKQNEYDDLKTSSFYSEHYQKPHKGKIKEMIVPLLIVALLGSVIGGALVGAWFQFGAPAIAGDTGNNVINNRVETQPVKQIEIIDKTDSPVTAIAEKVSPSIVGIQVNYRIQDFWFGTQVGSGSGSGIIIRSDGYILTNNHVIERAAGTGNTMAQGASISVILPYQKDRSYDAKIVGRDEKTDLAILKIDLTDLPAADLGDSDQLKVGELAVAIGNPAGIEFMGTVTSGIISGLNREVQISQNHKLKVIQTDAAINPGNSGGALVNSRGEVIGVNTLKISGVSGEYEGLGFAIPINTAKEIIDDLIVEGYVRGRPKLGVYFDPRLTEERAQQLGVPMGFLVYEVEPLSGAYNAGIRVGDIITEFNGVRVKDFNELENEKNKCKAGDVVTIKLYRIKNIETREGEYLTLEVTLGEDKG